ncbi:hypothetical protein QWA68_003438 [Fusarium oxysporum]|nr:hypothetical protein QWA68_003438 [Fusarium oxysporum]
MSAQEDISTAKANDPDEKYVPLQEESEHEADCQVVDPKKLSPDVLKNINKSTKTLTRTPWARKFRDSLKQGEPNFLSYFGALEVFGGEQQLPSGILSLLDSWSSNGTEQQKAERRAVLKFMRTMAAELGYGYGDAYLAVTETKRTTRLVFIAPESQRPGHAPGQRKGYKMGEIPKKPEKKRPSGVASKRPAKRARKDGPSASTEDNEEDESSYMTPRRRT